MPKLILASTSPRRKDALERLGIPFMVVPNNIDEEMGSSDLNEDPEKVALHLSRLKAESVAPHYPHHFILGMDTLILINGRIIGKPRNEDDALGILRALSGNWHRVITGITLYNAENEYLRQCAASSEVKFRDLSENEIKVYIALGESLDKAGGYGIQSEGKQLVEEVIGDISNVVGFPEKPVLSMLKQAGFPLKSTKSK